MKTLSDPRENLVNYKPHDSSIGRLRKKPHPPVGRNTKRIEGVETTNYRVAARLVEMKLEDDRGYPSGDRGPECAGQDDDRGVPRHDLQRRLELAAEGENGERPLGDHRGLRSASSSHFTDLSGKANITGIGFFDIPHGQTGIAPNAIELHPVLKFLASSCSH